MKDNMLADLASELLTNASDNNNTLQPPSPMVVRDIIYDLRELVFPEFFMLRRDDRDAYMALMYTVFHTLKEQMKAAYAYSGSFDDPSEEKCRSFFSTLPKLQKMLQLDMAAGYEGDPAAKSVSEVALTYPGFFAIYVYRVAHELYQLEVPYLPRMMTEYAHSKTGIDINPGAQIGESFFIDHGTGIVVGETTVIGNSVKLYQGVTLGALSTRGGQRLANVRRHPTVEDNVTIYAGATILGGNTVIGQNTTIGGCTFITESVDPNVTRHN